MFAALSFKQKSAQTPFPHSYVKNEGEKRFNVCMNLDTFVSKALYYHTSFERVLHVYFDVCEHPLYKCGNIPFSLIDGILRYHLNKQCQR